jgi:XRE family transcriptional regulator, regulator of sulfur utilization
MLTRRDLLLFASALCLSLPLGIGIGRGSLMASAHASAEAARAPSAESAGSQPKVQDSALFDWNDLTPNPTGVGQYRGVLRAKTATLDELELHVTTLNPGQISHPPHKHPNEELVIIDSGKIEATSNGKTRVLGPGSVIFNASNQLHGVKNVGDTPATYHVINWHTPATDVQARAAEAKR